MGALGRFGGGLRAGRWGLCLERPSRGFWSSWDRARRTATTICWCAVFATAI